VAQRRLAFDDCFAPEPLSGLSIAINRPPYRESYVTHALPARKAWIDVPRWDSPDHQ